MKAVIFDFNGTLFFDSDINEWAWRQTINELSDNKIDFDKEYIKVELIGDDSSNVYYFYYEDMNE